MSSDIQLEAMTSYKSCVCNTGQRVQNDVTVPPISKTPGGFTGAQFELMEYAEIKVSG